MSINFLLKRSAVASKRPTAAQLDIGELSLNYDASTAGVFFEDSAGNVRKIGPVEVSATAPNSAPAGSSGNSLGELWYDTSTNNLKIWTGASFVAATATADAGGSDTQVQYNSSGSLAGSSVFTFDTVQGQVSSTFVRSSNSIGDEGGEFRYALPVTNTTLVGSVATDIFQNRWRVFETSGTNRGMYVDLTALGTSVGTQIATSVDKLSLFAATTSAELAGVISDETGSGALVFATSPTLVTPAIGAATGTSLSLTGDITIGDKIIHDGDTNTAIRFPAADTVTVETNGSERARIDSSGRLLVGTSSFAQTNTYSNFQKLNVAGGGGEGIQLQGYSADQFNLAIDFSKSRGASVGTNTIVQNADSLGNLIFNGYDGSVYRQAAKIEAFVDGTPGANDMPGRLVFSTTPSGSSTLAARMTIKNDGKVGIGTQSPGLTLDVGGGSTATSLGGLNNMFLYAGFAPTGGGNTFAGVALGSGINGNSPTVAGTRTGAGSAATLNLATDGTTKVVISGNGDVGVGTFPGNFFHVSKGGTMPSLDGSEVSTFQWNASTGTSASVMIVAGTGASSAVYFADVNNNDQGFLRYEHVNDALSIGVNNGERVRINSGGYLKASNTGTYLGSTSNYHELRQSGLPRVVIVTATNASYAEGALTVDVTRSANSAYKIFEAYSGAFGNRLYEFRGDGDAFADGTFNNNGADYAEYFETLSGEAIPIGSVVALDGDKVREANENDPDEIILGVVRPKEPGKASMVVGNTAWNKWANTYLTDDFDRFIMEDHDVMEWIDEDGVFHSYESHRVPEDITVPPDATVRSHDDNGIKFQHYKLNPNYDPSIEYISRENRNEWVIIGLIGQVKILKGQRVGSRWIKMRDVSSTVEEWMIR